MRLPGGVAILLLVFAESLANANVLLMIDVSDPAAVSFDATSGLSLVDDRSTTGFDGVTLLSFLTEDPDSLADMTGTLSPTGASGAFDYVSTFDTFVAPLGVNLHVGESDDTLTFSTVASAFTGSGVADLSGWALPTPGTTGDIVAGDAVTGSGAVLGQWQVALLSMDLNEDGTVDSADADLLCSAIAVEATQVRLDLNRDGVVNARDMERFLTAVPTSPGDANLDGLVTFADFLPLAQTFGSAASWSHGDFDCDGQAGFSDFLVLSRNFGDKATAAVPEPTHGAMLAVALLIPVFRRSNW